MCIAMLFVRWSIKLVHLFDDGETVIENVQRIDECVCVCAYIGLVVEYLWFNLNT